MWSHTLIPRAISCYMWTMPVHRAPIPLDGPPQYLRSDPTEMMWKVPGTFLRSASAEVPSKPRRCVHPLIGQICGSPKRVRNLSIVVWQNRGPQTASCIRPLKRQKRPCSYLNNLKGWSSEFSKTTYITIPKTAWPVQRNCESWTRSSLYVSILLGLGPKTAWRLAPSDIADIFGAPADQVVKLFE